MAKVYKVVDPLQPGTSTQGLETDWGQVRSLSGRHVRGASLPSRVYTFPHREQGTRKFGLDFWLRNIVRRDMFKMKNQFGGSFEPNSQEDSVPVSRLALVAMVLNGPNIKAQSSSSTMPQPGAHVFPSY
ncbi:hypothetical protein GWK47_021038 [Chionoecetes opilio]|uniref:Uncharacterized protein n=1 Tax=Chionoecetes opilio TaxID=41210 RepID=A0A8J5CI46_CHIOP|nr:hypothetical protein GWK47_021038 [Chionoecetes opilio]